VIEDIFFAGAPITFYLQKGKQLYSLLRKFIQGRKEDI